MYLTPRTWNDDEEIDRKDALLRKCRELIETLTEDLENERVIRMTAESKYEILKDKYSNYDLEIQARDETIERL